MRIPSDIILTHGATDSVSLLPLFHIEGPERRLGTVVYSRTTIAGIPTDGPPWESHMEITKDRYGRSIWHSPGESSGLYVGRYDTLKEAIEAVLYLSSFRIQGG